jgi:4-hydroxyacetophenone monooxygenase
VETEVTEASWDDPTATSSVRARHRSGATTTLSARAVISAVGQLNRPQLREIDGQGNFAGPAFHSSEWDHAVDLRGKRVAMVGAGASGCQIAPAIADDVDRLTVFQRTAQWMFPNPNYHAEVGPGVQWALRHLPFYGRWYRFLLFWPGCDKGLEAARVDAEYPDKQTAVSEINEITRIMFTELDQQPDRRRCGTAGQGGARLPGDGQAHPAGQWQLVAHADPRQRRVGQDWHRPHRIKRGRHRRRHPLPG